MSTIPDPSALVLGSFILLCLANLAQGYTTFDTECSTPKVPTNFVSSPNSRGTLDILWSCAFMIIACTWSIQHLNVPEQREGRDPGKRGDLKWMLKGAWRTTKWMLVTIIAPEVVLGKAWGDLVDAKEHLEELQSFAEEDDVPWTMTHSLFANMGGFVIRFDVDRITKHLKHIGTQSNNDGPEGTAPGEIQPQTSPACYPSRLEESIDENGPDMIREGLKRGNSHPQYNNPFHLNAPYILRLRKSGLLSRLPCITLEEINDKSKSDSMVRAIAVIQILWTTIQIIARAYRHLAVTQLEIAVIAFAVCAIITYGLNWYRPKGVLVPFTLLQYCGKIPNQVCRIIEADLNIEHSWVTLLTYQFGRRKRQGLPPSNSSNLFGARANIFGILVASIIFGSLHVTAWNLAFPTEVEKILWRATSIWCTAALPISFLVMWGATDLDDYITEKNYFGGNVWFIDLFIIIFPSSNFGYVLARLYLMVEIFRSLCFLPPDAYISTWATNIPHIA